MPAKRHEVQLAGIVGTSAGRLTPQCSRAPITGVSGQGIMTERTANGGGVRPGRPGVKVSHSGWGWVGLGDNGGMREN